MNSTIPHDARSSAAGVINRGGEGQGRRRPRSSPLRLALVTGAVLLLSFSMWPGMGRAHEPITTKVRFNKEVVRIFQRSCLGCHRPGGAAPMSLATYEEARPWAKAIKEELLEKRMPPWHAVKGYGEFSNVPPLTQREIGLIVNWVEGGAPKGDDKLLPEDTLFSDDWSLGNPDLILKPDSMTTVASDADEYRHFALPVGNDEDLPIAAFEVKPGDASVVHCASIYIGQIGDVVTEQPPKGGAMEYGTPAAASRSIPVATWVPGLKSVRLPGGFARRLPRGSNIVLKVHYRGAGEETKDRPEVGLYFSQSPQGGSVVDTAVDASNAGAPAGDASRITATHAIADDSHALSIRPAINERLISFQATAYRPDGTEEILIWVRGSTDDWQPTYYFKRPVPLPRGTQVEVIAYLEGGTEAARSSPSEMKKVRWGDLTPDPLCILGLAKASPSQSKTVPASTR